MPLFFNLRFIFRGRMYVSAQKRYEIKVLNLKGCQYCIVGKLRSKFYKKPMLK